MEFTAIKNRLFLLDTSHLCDASTEVKIIDRNIRPIRTGLKMIGIAHTVSCDGDLLPVIKGLTTAQPDEILVINTNDANQAVAGEIFATVAMKRKIAGIIIDGACRDTAALSKMDFCMYAKIINPQAGTKQKMGINQIPINFGGVLISPGDILFGDDDGIVVLAPHNIAEILEKAENIRKNETVILQQISMGKNLLELTNYIEHWENIAKGNNTKSIFKFKI